MADITRRQALSLIGLGAAGGTLMSAPAFAQQASADATSLLPGADVCVITPEVTEGPYYFDPELERADITEGRAGVPLVVRLQVVDAACQPLPGARVDLWHCDAAGLYSGYPNQTGGVDTTGQTFLRGTLFANAAGVAEFTTIYPGWYRGRTTHLHFKVFLSETAALTGQIFFPDALSQFLYDNVPPYNARAETRDTLNSGDGIARQATRASYAYVKELDEAYVAAMIVGVDPNAQPAEFGFGAGGGRMPPDGPPPGGGPGPSGGGNATLDRAMLVPSAE